MTEILAVEVYETFLNRQQLKIKSGLTIDGDSLVCDGVEMARWENGGLVIVGARKGESKRIARHRNNVVSLSRAKEIQTAMETRGE